MPDDFFAEEQKTAIRAMANCCRESWQVIKQDTNLEPLIRKRPLISLAAAAAGGLIAGYMLTPPPNRKPHQAPRNHMRNGKVKPEHKSFLVRMEGRAEPRRSAGSANVRSVIGRSDVLRGPPRLYERPIARAAWASGRAAGGGSDLMARWDDQARFCSIRYSRRLSKLRVACMGM